jgi:serine/threonine protein kinase
VRFDGGMERTATIVEELQWEELHPEVDHAPKIGAFGTVFKARRQIGRNMYTDVAVKALRIHSAGLNQHDYEQAVCDLKTEAHILQTASNGIINDFVVKFHGVVCGKVPIAWLEKFNHANFHLPSTEQGESTPELLALVMKYESGGNLEDLLHGRNGQKWHGCTIDRIRLLMEISTGLWHLHNYSSHCIIHGDIKSANVLLSGEQGDTSALHVRLTDFGLSSMNSAAARCSRHSSLIHTAERRGTWPYMAPEMYSRKKQMGCVASRCTDMYALGTLMWEVRASNKHVHLYMLSPNGITYPSDSSSLLIFNPFNFVPSFFTRPFFSHQK